MLIRTNMEDLRDTTHGRHYELYRKDRLKEMGFTDNEGKPGNFAEQVTPCPVFPQNEPVNGQISAPYLLIKNNNNKNNIKWSPTAKF